MWNKINESEESLKQKYITRPKAIFSFDGSDIKKDSRHYISEIDRVTDKDNKNFKNSEDAQEKARHYTCLYLSSDYIDVYVATSMRSKRNFENVAEKIEKIFSNEDISELRLRYFNPTISATPYERINKGLVEALMLKRAKVTLYLAQDSDSLGKDSELASTLIQGKDVIVLVPEINIEERINYLKSITPEKIEDELDYLRPIACKYATAKDKGNTNYEIAHKILKSEANIFKDDEMAKNVATLEHDFYDKRSNLLKSKHPLGLQVNIATGVAHGVIVVRNEADAAKMLYRSLTNSHKYIIEDNGKENCINLVEATTNSVIRFSTKDTFLAKSFWSHYTDMDRHQ